MIAIYIGSLRETAPSTIARIPIIKTSIEENLDMCSESPNNPNIPNTIIINPTI